MSIPSAMKATFTPAPVNPSERAVGSDGVLLSAWINSNSSPRKAGWPGAGQAPGGMGFVLEAAAGVPSPAGGLMGSVTSGPRTGESGMTSSTAGLAARRAASPAETVAEMASTNE